MIEPHDRVPHPALLIVDMQNDFVRVGAALEVVDARATIPANQALIRLFRDHCPDRDHAARWRRHRRL